MLTTEYSCLILPSMMSLMLLPVSNISMGFLSRDKSCMTDPFVVSGAGGDTEQEKAKRSRFVNKNQLHSQKPKHQIKFFPLFSYHRMKRSPYSGKKKPTKLYKPFSNRPECVCRAF